MASDSGTKVFKCVPRYIIDLDLPPSQRWNQVVDDYKEKWKAVDDYAKELVKSVIGPTLGPAVDFVIRSTLKSLVGRAHYSLEMKAIAERSKMDLGRLVLLQHIYEASACCTSIVLDGDTHPIHIRCMDWEMDILKPLTIEIDCRKGGQTVFVATTWAGFLGVFTGMRPGQWSCSLNFRVTSQGSFWENLKSAMHGATPSGFLMRRLLESEPSFDAAVEALANTPVVAPCYISVCGSSPGQGTLITRNLKGEENRWLISEKGPFVQTNIDHWSFDNSEDVMDSITRRELAFNTLERKPTPLTEEWLWAMMSKQPILNEITIYGTLMIPAERRFMTIIPSGRRGYKPRDPPAQTDTQNPELTDYRFVPVTATPEEYVACITVPPIEKPTCSRCGVEYGPFTNPKGQCIHSGTWHATFSDCNYAACGAGLFPSNIGKQHWSCCYSTDADSTICSKSKSHVPAAVPQDVDLAVLPED